MFHIAITLQNRHSHPTQILYILSHAEFADERSEYDLSEKTHFSKNHPHPRLGRVNLEKGFPEKSSTSTFLQGQKIPFKLTLPKTLPKGGIIQIIPSKVTLIVKSAYRRMWSKLLPKMENRHKRARSFDRWSTIRTVSDMNVCNSIREGFR